MSRRLWRIVRSEAGIREFGIGDSVGQAEPCGFAAASTLHDEKDPLGGSFHLHGANRPAAPALPNPQSRIPNPERAKRAQAYAALCTACTDRPDGSTTFFSDGSHSSAAAVEQATDGPPGTHSAAQACG
jgi:hypothetical protein